MQLAQHMVKNDSKCLPADYCHKNLLKILNTERNQLNLIQLLNEAAWQRVVNNVLKSSTLDHLYVTDPNYQQCNFYRTSDRRSQIDNI